MPSIDEQFLDAMAINDQTFFQSLGKRVAELRKEQHLTQTQLAEMLEISQQHMASFEVGRRKIPASLLPQLSQILAVTLEDLLGVKTNKPKRGPAPKLMRQMEQISRLPKTKQRFVMDMLDNVLQ